MYWKDCFLIVCVRMYVYIYMYMDGWMDTFYFLSVHRSHWNLLIDFKLSWEGKRENQASLMSNGMVCQNLRILRKPLLMGSLNLLQEVLTTMYHTWYVSTIMHMTWRKKTGCFGSVPEIWYWHNWNLVGWVLSPLTVLERAEEVGGGLVCNR